MARVHLFFSIVLASGAFFAAADVSEAEQSLPLTLSVNTHTNTLSTPLTASASLFADLKNSYQTVGVCFIGFGDCMEDAGFGRGGDDYSLDTASQCKNEGYVLNNCNSVQSPKDYCPYNKSYVSGCKCASNLITCPAGQVGVGDACEGKYASCKCDPNLISCASNQTGQGASCGGKYQSCVCKSEYQYNSSNCTSPRSLTGASCGGKYTGCSCPGGITSLPYGCEEYYASPCNSVCKKAYVDNCRNRTAVSTPYGCQTYWADCPSKCQKAYPDNCRNRTAATCAFGCQTYWSDCQSKCQTCKTDNCANRAAANAPYGCQTYWPDCSSKCQVAFADNCRNRTAVSTPYGCQTYWPDCKSKCQTAYADNCRNRPSNVSPQLVAIYGCMRYWPDCPTKCQQPNPTNCTYAARTAHPEAVVVGTMDELRTAAVSGKKIYLSSDLDLYANFEIKNGTAIHSAYELAPKYCQDRKWGGIWDIYEGTRINVPLSSVSLYVLGSFSFSKDIILNNLYFGTPPPGISEKNEISITSENDAKIQYHSLGNSIEISNDSLKSIFIDNLVWESSFQLDFISHKDLTVTLRKSGEIQSVVLQGGQGKFVLEDGTFNIERMAITPNQTPYSDGTEVLLKNANVNLHNLEMWSNLEIVLDNSTVDAVDKIMGTVLAYYNNSSDTSVPTGAIRFKNGSKWLHMGDIGIGGEGGYALEFVFEPNSHSYIETRDYGACMRKKISAQNPAQEARLQSYSSSYLSSAARKCFSTDYYNNYTKKTNIKIE